MNKTKLLFLSEKTAFAIFLSFIILYSFILVYKASWGAIDDYHLLDTLLVGKAIPINFYIQPEIGRFYPLNAHEYNIIAFFSTSPWSFYAYNACQLILFAILFYKILNKLFPLEDKRFLMLVVSITILLPGFVNSWFLLFCPERNVIFFMALFLFFYLKFKESQNTYFMFISIIFANIALYYKETTFAMLSSFAVLHLFLNWEDGKYKQKIFDFLIIFSSFIYLLLYYFMVYTKKGNILYGENIYDKFLVLFKNLFCYSLNDSIILFVFIPLFIYRLRNLIANKESADKLMDSMALGGLSYFMAFVFLTLKLKLLFMEHYLLPSYIFILPATIYYFRKYEFEFKKIKYLFFAGLFFLIANALPLSIYRMAFYKTVNLNFQKTINFLEQYIKSKKNEKVSIFLEGVNRNSEAALYYGFRRYLEFNGLNYEYFDLKNSEDDNMWGPVKINKESHYTYESNNSASRVNKGDLVIITPYIKSYKGKSDIVAMTKDYDILFNTSSIEIPNMSLKQLIKYYLGEMNSNSRKLVNYNNYLGLPLNFYVLRKK